MKKLSCLLLVLALLCTSAVALADVTDTGTYPIVTEPITLRIAAHTSAKCEDLATNELSKWIAEKSGINIEWIPLSPTETATQINGMLLNGDLPDMFWGYNFSYATLADYVDAGYIAPLDEYIEKYGDNLYDYLSKTSCENPMSFVTIDDHVYALPTDTELLTDIYGHFPFRYQTVFTNALNMEEPKTLDEFYQMLVAFKYNDPNGNGMQDEIPMTGSKDSNYVLNFIGSAYQYTDSRSFLKVNDGKVSFVADNDLFKETIEFIKKLVDEGLYDPAAFTQDTATLKTINVQDDIICGVSTDGYGMGSSFGGSDFPERYFGMRLLGALEGPYGYKATVVDMPSVNRALVMTTACKNPEAAYRLMDMMLSLEAAEHARLGVEGVNYEKAPEGSIGRDGQQAWYKLIGTQEWSKASTNVIWVQQNMIFSNVMNHVATVYNEATGYWDSSYYLAQSCNEKLSKTVTGENLPNLLMNVEDSAEYESLQKVIVDYVKQSSTAFILGDRPMTEWDAYVAEFEAMGLNRYIELAQNALDNMK